MTLAVSNIAWPADREPEVARLLADLGVTAVEIAPTKVFEDPLAATRAEVAAYRRWWGRWGVDIIAFQSLLFGGEDFRIFDEAAARNRTAERLRGMIRLAGDLGAPILVFGSPRNRRVPDNMSVAEANTIAIDFFGALAVAARAEGTCLCIEPNPPAYDCNFVTTSVEGSALVREVNDPGFGLHLDVAAMTLAGECPAIAIPAAIELRHFHISAPQLGPIESVIVDHAAAAAALRDIGYAGNLSIEMRPTDDPVGAVRDAVASARRWYDAV